MNSLSSEITSLVYLPLKGTRWLAIQNGVKCALKCRVHPPCGQLTPTHPRVVLMQCNRRSASHSAHDRRQCGITVTMSTALVFRITGLPTSYVIRYSVFTPQSELPVTSNWFQILGLASSGMLRRVVLVRTGVSEELSASFIKVTRICELGTTLAVTSNGRILFMFGVGVVPSPLRLCCVGDY
jgi:hypothetical protein